MPVTNGCHDNDTNCSSARGQPVTPSIPHSGSTPLSAVRHVISPREFASVQCRITSQDVSGDVTCEVAAHATQLPPLQPSTSRLRRDGSPYPLTPCTNSPPPPPQIHPAHTPTALNMPARRSYTPSHLQQQQQRVMAWRGSPLETIVMQRHAPRSSTNVFTPSRSQQSRSSSSASLGSPVTWPSHYSLPTASPASTAAAGGVEQEQQEYVDEKLAEFHAAIHHLQDEQQRVQKKTFMNWINSRLKLCQPPLQIACVINDLRDGAHLLALLQTLSGHKLRIERGRRLKRPHFISNIRTALEFLASRNVKLVNINACDIVDGKPSVVLGLVWTIILHFQIEENTRHVAMSFDASCSSTPLSSPGRSVLNASTGSTRGTARHSLLNWAREAAVGVTIKDFGPSWRDGRAFVAIVHCINPTVIDRNHTNKMAVRQRLNTAFNVAEYRLGIPRLLDPEDVDVPSPEEKSIMTYVSQFLHKYPEPRAVGASVVGVPAALVAISDWLDTSILRLSQLSIIDKNDFIAYLLMKEELSQQRGVYDSMLDQYSAASSADDSAAQAAISYLQQLTSKWTSLTNLLQEWQGFLDSRVPSSLLPVIRFLTCAELFLDADSGATDSCVDGDSFGSSCETSTVDGVARLLREHDELFRELPMITAQLSEAASCPNSAQLPPQQLQQLECRLQAVGQLANTHRLKLHTRYQQELWRVFSERVTTVRCCLKQTEQSLISGEVLRQAMQTTQPENGSCLRLLEAVEQVSAVLTNCDLDVAQRRSMQLQVQELNTRWRCVERGQRAIIDCAGGIQLMARVLDAADSCLSPQQLSNTDQLLAWSHHCSHTADQLSCSHKQLSAARDIWGSEMTTLSESVCECNDDDGNNATTTAVIDSCLNRSSSAAERLHQLLSDLQLSYALCQQVTERCSQIYTWWSGVVSSEMITVREAATATVGGADDQLRVDSTLEYSTRLHHWSEQLAHHKQLLLALLDDVERLKQLLTLDGEVCVPEELTCLVSEATSAISTAEITLNQLRSGYQQLSDADSSANQLLTSCSLQLKKVRECVAAGDKLLANQSLDTTALRLWLLTDLSECDVTLTCTQQKLNEVDSLIGQIQVSGVSAGTQSKELQLLHSRCDTCRAQLSQIADKMLASVDADICERVAVCDCNIKRLAERATEFLSHIAFSSCRNNTRQLSDQLTAFKRFVSDVKQSVEDMERTLEVVSDVLPGKRLAELKIIAERLRTEYNAANDHSEQTVNRHNHLLSLTERFNLAFDSVQSDIAGYETDLTATSVEQVSLEDLPGKIAAFKQSVISEQMSSLLSQLQSLTDEIHAVFSCSEAESCQFTTAADTAQSRITNCQLSADSLCRQLEDLSESELVLRSCIDNANRWIHHTESCTEQVASCMIQFDQQSHRGKLELNDIDELVDVNDCNQQVLELISDVVSARDQLLNSPHLSADSCEQVRQQCCSTVNQLRLVSSRYCSAHGQLQQSEDQLHSLSSWLQQIEDRLAHNIPTDCLHELEVYRNGLREICVDLSRSDMLAMLNSLSSGHWLYSQHDRLQCMLNERMSTCDTYLTEIEQLNADLSAISQWLTDQQTILSSYLSDNVSDNSTETSTVRLLFSALHDLQQHVQSSGDAQLKAVWRKACRMQQRRVSNEKSTPASTATLSSPLNDVDSSYSTPVDQSIYCDKCGTAAGASVDNYDAVDCHRSQCFCDERIGKLQCQWRDLVDSVATSYQVELLRHRLKAVQMKMSRMQLQGNAEENLSLADEFELMLTSVEQYIADAKNLSDSSLLEQLISCKQLLIEKLKRLRQAAVQLEQMESYCHQLRCWLESAESQLSILETLSNEDVDGIISTVATRVEICHRLSEEMDDCCHRLLQPVVSMIDHLTAAPVNIHKQHICVLQQRWNYFDCQLKSSRSAAEQLHQQLQQLQLLYSRLYDWLQPQLKKLYSVVMVTAETTLSAVADDRDVVVQYSGSIEEKRQKLQDQKDLYDQLVEYSSRFTQLSRDTADLSRLLSVDNVVRLSDSSTTDVPVCSTTNTSNTGSETATTTALNCCVALAEKDFPRLLVISQSVVCQLKHSVDNHQQLVNTTDQVETAILSFSESMTSLNDVTGCQTDVEARIEQLQKLYSDFSCLCEKLQLSAGEQLLSAAATSSEHGAEALARLVTDTTHKVYQLREKYGETRAEMESVANCWRNFSALFSDLTQFCTDHRDTVQQASIQSVHSLQDKEEVLASIGSALTSVTAREGEMNGLLKDARALEERCCVDKPMCQARLLYGDYQQLYSRLKSAVSQWQLVVDEHSCFDQLVVRAETELSQLLTLAEKQADCDFNLDSVGQLVAELGCAGGRVIVNTGEHGRNSIQAKIEDVNNRWSRLQSLATHAKNEAVRKQSALQASANCCELVSDWLNQHRQLSDRQHCQWNSCTQISARINKLKSILSAACALDERMQHCVTELQQVSAASDSCSEQLQQLRTAVKSASDEQLRLTTQLDNWQLLDKLVAEHKSALSLVSDSLIALQEIDRFDSSQQLSDGVDECEKLLKEQQLAVDRWAAASTPAGQLRQLLTPDELVELAQLLEKEAASEEKLKIEISQHRKQLQLQLDCFLSQEQLVVEQTAELLGYEQLLAQLSAVKSAVTEKQLQLELITNVVQKLSSQRIDLESNFSAFKSEQLCSASSVISETSFSDHTEKQSHQLRLDSDQTDHSSDQDSLLAELKRSAITQESPEKNAQGNQRVAEDIVDAPADAATDTDALAVNSTLHADSRADVHLSADTAEVNVCTGLSHSAVLRLRSILEPVLVHNSHLLSIGKSLLDCRHSELQQHQLFWSDSDSCLEQISCSIQQCSAIREKSVQRSLLPSLAEQADQLLRDCRVSISHQLEQLQLLIDQLLDSSTADGCEKLVERLKQLQIKSTEMFAEVDCVIQLITDLDSRCGQFESALDRVQCLLQQLTAEAEHLQLPAAALCATLDDKCDQLSGWQKLHENTIQLRQELSVCTDFIVEEVDEGTHWHTELDRVHASVNQLIQQTESGVSECESVVSAHRHYTATVLGVQELLEGCQSVHDLWSQPRADPADVDLALTRLKQLEQQLEEQSAVRLEQLQLAADGVIPGTNESGRTNITAQLDSMRLESQTLAVSVRESVESCGKLLEQCRHVDRMYGDWVEWLDKVDLLLMQPSSHHSVSLQNKQQRLTELLLSWSELEQRRAQVDLLVGGDGVKLSAIGGSRAGSMAGLIARFRLVTTRLQDGVNQCQKLVDTHTRFSDQLDEIDSFVSSFTQRLNSCCDWDELISSEQQLQLRLDAVREFSADIESGNALVQNLTPLKAAVLSGTDREGHQAVVDLCNRTEQRWSCQCDRVLRVKLALERAVDEYGDFFSAVDRLRRFLAAAEEQLLEYGSCQPTLSAKRLHLDKLKVLGQRLCGESVTAAGSTTPSTTDDTYSCSDLLSLVRSTLGQLTDPDFSADDDVDDHDGHDDDVTRVVCIDTGPATELLQRHGWLMEQVKSAISERQQRFDQHRHWKQLCDQLQLLMTSLLEQRSGCHRNYSQSDRCDLESSIEALQAVLEKRSTAEQLVSKLVEAGKLVLESTAEPGKLEVQQQTEEAQQQTCTFFQDVGEQCEHMKCVDSNLTDFRQHYDQLSDRLLSFDHQLKQLKASCPNSFSQLQQLHTNSQSVRDQLEAAGGDIEQLQLSASQLLQWHVHPYVSQQLRHISSRHQVLLNLSRDLAERLTAVSDQLQQLSAAVEAGHSWVAEAGCKLAELDVGDNVRVVYSRSELQSRLHGVQDMFGSEHVGKQLLDTAATLAESASRTAVVSAICVDQQLLRGGVKQLSADWQALVTQLTRVKTRLESGLARCDNAGATCCHLSALISDWSCQLDQLQLSTAEISAAELHVLCRCKQERINKLDELIKYIVQLKSSVDTAVSEAGDCQSSMQLISDYTAVEQKTHQLQLVWGEQLEQFQLLLRQSIQLSEWLDSSRRSAVSCMNPAAAAAEQGSWSDRLEVLNLKVLELEKAYDEGKSLLEQTMATAESLCVGDVANSNSGGGSGDGDAEVDTETVERHAAGLQCQMEEYRELLADVSRHVKLAAVSHQQVEQLLAECGSWLEDCWNRLDLIDVPCRDLAEKQRAVETAQSMLSEVYGKQQCVDQLNSSAATCVLVVCADPEVTDRVTHLSSRYSRLQSRLKDVFRQRELEHLEHKQYRCLCDELDECTRSISEKLHELQLVESPDSSCPASTASTALAQLAAVQHLHDALEHDCKKLSYATELRQQLIGRLVSAEALVQSATDKIADDSDSSHGGSGGGGEHFASYTAEGTVAAVLCDGGSSSDVTTGESAYTSAVAPHQGGSSSSAEENDATLTAVDGVGENGLHPSTGSVEEDADTSPIADNENVVADTDPLESTANEFVIAGVGDELAGISEEFHQLRKRISYWIDKLTERVHTERKLKQACDKLGENIDRVEESLSNYLELHLFSRNVVQCQAQLNRYESCLSSLQSALKDDQYRDIFITDSIHDSDSDTDAITRCQARGSELMRMVQLVRERHQSVLERVQRIVQSGESWLATLTEYVATLDKAETVVASRCEVEQLLVVVDNCDEQTLTHRLDLKTKLLETLTTDNPVDRLRDLVTKLHEIAPEACLDIFNKEINSIQLNVEQLKCTCSEVGDQLESALQLLKQLTAGCGDISEWLTSTEQLLTQLTPATTVSALSCRLQQLKELNSEAVQRQQQLIDMTSAGQLLADLTGHLDCVTPIADLTNRLDLLMTQVQESETSVEEKLSAVSQLHHCRNQLQLWLSTAEQTVRQCCHLGDNSHTLKLCQRQLEVLKDGLVGQRTALNRLKKEECTTGMLLSPTDNHAHTTGDIDAACNPMDDERTETVVSSSSNDHKSANELESLLNQLEDDLISTLSSVNARVNLVDRANLLLAAVDEAVIPAEQLLKQWQPDSFTADDSQLLSKYQNVSEKLSSCGAAVDQLEQLLLPSPTAEQCEQLNEKVHSVIRRWHVADTECNQLVIHLQTRIQANEKYSRLLCESQQWLLSTSHLLVSLSGEQHAAHPAPHPLDAALLPASNTDISSCQHQDKLCRVQEVVADIDAHAERMCELQSVVSELSSLSAIDPSSLAVHSGDVCDRTDGIKQSKATNSNENATAEVPSQLTHVQNKCLANENAKTEVLSQSIHVKDKNMASDNVKTEVLSSLTHVQNSYQSVRETAQRLLERVKESVVSQERSDRLLSELENELISLQHTDYLSPLLSQSEKKEEHDASHVINALRQPVVEQCILQAGVLLDRLGSLSRRLESLDHLQTISHPIDSQSQPTLSMPNESRHSRLKRQISVSSRCHQLSIERLKDLSSCYQHLLSSTDQLGHWIADQRHLHEKTVTSPLQSNSPRSAVVQRFVHIKHQLLQRVACLLSSRNQLVDVAEQLLGSAGDFQLFLQRTADAADDVTPVFVEQSVELQLSDTALNKRLNSVVKQLNRAPSVSQLLPVCLQITELNSMCDEALSAVNEAYDLFATFTSTLEDITSRVDHVTLTTQALDEKTFDSNERCQVLSRLSDTLSQCENECVPTLSGLCEKLGPLMSSTDHQKHSETLSELHHRIDQLRGRLGTSLHQAHTVATTVFQCASQLDCVRQLCQRAESDIAALPEHFPLEESACSQLLSHVQSMLNELKSGQQTLTQVLSSVKQLEMGSETTGCTLHTDLKQLQTTISSASDRLFAHLTAVSKAVKSRRQLQLLKTAAETRLEQLEQSHTEFSSEILLPDCLTKLDHLIELNQGVLSDLNAMLDQTIPELQQAVECVCTDCCEQDAAELKSRMDSLGADIQQRLDRVSSSCHQLKLCKQLKTQLEECESWLSAAGDQVHSIRVGVSSLHDMQQHVTKMKLLKTDLSARSTELTSAEKLIDQLDSQLQTYFRDGVHDLQSQIDKLSSRIEKRSSAFNQAVDQQERINERVSVSITHLADIRRQLEVLSVPVSLQVADIQIVISRYEEILKQLRDFHKQLQLLKKHALEGVAHLQQLIQQQEQLMDAIEKQIRKFNQLMLIVQQLDQLLTEVSAFVSTNADLSSALRNTPLTPEQKIHRCQQLIDKISEMEVLLSNADSKLSELTELSTITPLTQNLNNNNDSSDQQPMTSSRDVTHLSTERWREQLQKLRSQLQQLRQSVSDSLIQYQQVVEHCSHLSVQFEAECNQLDRLDHQLEHVTAVQQLSDDEQLLILKQLQLVAVEKLDLCKQYECVITNLQSLLEKSQCCSEMAGCKPTVALQRTVDKTATLVLPSARKQLELHKRRWSEYRDDLSRFSSSFHAVDSWMKRLQSLNSLLSSSASADDGVISCWEADGQTLNQMEVALNEQSHHDQYLSEMTSLTETITKTLTSSDRKSTDTPSIGRLLKQSLIQLKQQTSATVDTSRQLFEAATDRRQLIARVKQLMTSLQPVIKLVEAVTGDKLKHLQQYSDAEALHSQTVNAKDKLQAASAETSELQCLLSRANSAGFQLVNNCSVITAANQLVSRCQLQEQLLSQRCEWINSVITVWQEMESSIGDIQRCVDEVSLDLSGDKTVPPRSLTDLESQLTNLQILSDRLAVTSDRIGHVTDLCVRCRLLVTLHVTSSTDHPSCCCHTVDTCLSQLKTAVETLMKSVSERSDWLGVLSADSHQCLEAARRLHEQLQQQINQLRDSTLDTETAGSLLQNVLGESEVLTDEVTDLRDRISRRCFDIDDVTTEMCVVEQLLAQLQDITLRRSQALKSCVNQIDIYQQDVSKLRAQIADTELKLRSLSQPSARQHQQQLKQTYRDKLTSLYADVSERVRRVKLMIVSTTPDSHPLPRVHP